MISFARPDNAQCSAPIKCNWQWRALPSRSRWRQLSLPGPAVPKWASNFKEPCRCFCPCVLYWPMCSSEPLKLPDIIYLCCKEVNQSFICKKDSSLSSWIPISHCVWINRFFSNRADKFVGVASDFTWYVLRMPLTRRYAIFLQKQC
jgi:hypothetical protein